MINYPLTSSLREGKFLCFIVLCHSTQFLIPDKWCPNKCFLWLFFKSHTSTFNPSADQRRGAKDSVISVTKWKESISYSTSFHRRPKSLLEQLLNSYFLSIYQVLGSLHAFFLLAPHNSMKWGLPPRFTGEEISK